MCEIGNVTVVKVLTHDIISKLMLSNVVKQGGENWQQGDGCVVNVLGNTLYLLWGKQIGQSVEHIVCDNLGVIQILYTSMNTYLIAFRYFAKFKVLYHLLYIISSAFKEGPQPSFHNLRPRFHHCPNEAKNTVEN